MLFTKKKPKPVQWAPWERERIDQYRAACAIRG